MFCIKCGKELAEGTAFCPACGTKVGESIKDNPKNEEKTFKNREIVLVIMKLFFITLSVFLSFMYLIPFAISDLLMDFSKFENRQVEYPIFVLGIFFLGAMSFLNNQRKSGYTKTTNFKYVYNEVASCVSGVLGIFVGIMFFYMVKTNRNITNGQYNYICVGLLIVSAFLMFTLIKRAKTIKAEEREMVSCVFALGLAQCVFPFLVMAICLIPAVGAAFGGYIIAYLMIFLIVFEIIQAVMSNKNLKNFWSGK